MNHQTLKQICDQVYRRCPQVAGSQPRLQDRPDQQVLLIFRSTSQAEDGRTLIHAVRVVASQEGKIIKMTTSR